METTFEGIISGSSWEGSKNQENVERTDRRMKGGAVTMIPHWVDIFLFGVMFMIFSTGMAHIIKEIVHFRKYKRLRKDPLVILVFLTLFTVFGAGFVQRIQFYRTILALRAVERHHVTVFIIYPRSTRPVQGVTPVKFSSPDQIVDEFLKITEHFQAYWFSPGTLTSPDYDWYLEIITRNSIIKMWCSLEPDMSNIVLGEIGIMTNTGNDRYYGRFQSKLLFQWYQKYSHFWLNPDEPSLKQAR